MRAVRVVSTPTRFSVINMTTLGTMVETRRPGCGLLAARRPWPETREPWLVSGGRRPWNRRPWPVASGSHKISYANQHLRGVVIVSIIWVSTRYTTRGC